jgi:hypothetical protein
MVLVPLMVPYAFFFFGLDVGSFIITSHKSISQIECSIFIRFADFIRIGLFNVHKYAQMDQTCFLMWFMGDLKALKGPAVIHPHLARFVFISRW